MSIKLIIITIFFLNSCYANKHKLEKDYQEEYCNRVNGILEYRLNTKKRVDCLTNNEAIEFDFAKKVYECVGQSIYYGIKTNKQPMCVLIIRNQKDFKYLEIIETIIKKYNIKYDIIKDL